VRASQGRDGARDLLLAGLKRELTHQ
jgi:hypothetical protein